MVQPLNELLSAAAADFDREYAAAGGPPPSLELYANLLRVVPDDGIEQNELPALARLSKRAVKWNAGLAQRVGLVVLGGKRVELTEAGRSARDGAVRCMEAAEAAWRKRFGDEIVARLRASLEALVSRFDLELPHHPAGYGPADSSVTGGVAMRWGRRHALRVKGLPGMEFDAEAEHAAAEAWEKESGGRLYVREPGQDWRPVARGEADTVSGLPLYALLSQSLMAFAIDYEGCGGLALARSGNVLRLIPDDGLEIGVRASRSKGRSPFLPVDSGFAGLERHAYAAVVVDAEDKRRGRLTLTEKGRAVRDAYDDIVVAIEDRWKRRYGSPAVGELRSALSSLQNS